VHAGRTVTAMTSKPVSRWSLSYTGNRVLLAVLLAVVAYATTGSGLLFVLVGVLAFGLATIFFAPRRQPGTDRQP
jgi:branched-subunit amino acid transport protein